MLWLGHDVKRPFAVWRHLDDCPGVMVNAYQLLERPWFRGSVLKAGGVHGALGYEGLVFMDSAGYRLQRERDRNVSLTEVLALQRESRPDVAAVLDVPLSPLVSSQVNHRRWRRTVQNTAFMHSNNGNVLLAPVLHAYSIPVIPRRSDELKRIVEKPSVICLGSLVPLLRGSYVGTRFTNSRDKTPLTFQRWRFISRLILSVRRLYPGSTLHVFGAGSLTTMYLLFLLGADSFDSTSWRVKAAYGAIQLPGVPDRFPAPRRNANRVRRKLGAPGREILARCHCPACEGTDMERRVKSLSASFESRAIHNAHVFLSELRLLREASADGIGSDFVRDRLRGSDRFARILEDVVLPELQHSPASRGILGAGQNGAT